MGLGEKNLQKTVMVKNCNETNPLCQKNSRKGEGYIVFNLIKQNQIKDRIWFQPIEFKVRYRLLSVPQIDMNMRESVDKPDHSKI